jgi:hypothetical protein
MATRYGFTRQHDGSWTREEEHGRKLVAWIIEKERRLVSGGHWWVLRRAAYFNGRPDGVSAMLGRAEFSGGDCRLNDALRRARKAW